MIATEQFALSGSAAERSTAVDAYIAKAAPFAQPILEHLREAMHAGAPGVVEEMKWSRPFFVYRGVILGNISAFKQHCSLGLWGAEMSAKLRSDGIASSEAMGSFGRIATVDDLPQRRKLIGYIQTAAKAIADGERTKSWSRPRVAKPAVEVPEALAAALKKDKAAQQKFDAMTPSCRREYCEWIADAKRDETRERRLATAMAWIQDGKRRNWKHEQYQAT